MHRITCKQLSSRLPVIVTASLQAEVLHHTAERFDRSVACSWPCCMNAACYCHQMLALQLNRLLFLFVSFLYSKSCYLSSSYGYYHKYILSLISSWQTKTCHQWQARKNMYVTWQKLLSKPCTIFYTFAQFKPWCWSDMAFPVFFKMTYWSHNIFKNNYSTGIVSTFTDTL